MPTQLDRAINQIVDSALSGIPGPHQVDSPVRGNIPLITVPRSEWDGLTDEITQLKEAQADALVAAARKVAPAQAIDLLREAVQRNP